MNPREFRDHVDHIGSFYVKLNKEYRITEHANLRTRINIETDNLYRKIRWLKKPEIIIETSL